MRAYTVQYNDIVADATAERAPRHVQERFGSLVALLEKRCDATACYPPFKGGWRAIEEMVLTSGGVGAASDLDADLDGSTLCDVQRDALVCSSFSVLIDVLELLINLDHVRV